MRLIQENELDEIKGGIAVDQVGSQGGVQNISITFLRQDAGIIDIANQNELRGVGLHGFGFGALLQMHTQNVHKTIIGIVHGQNSPEYSHAVLAYEESEEKYNGLMEIKEIIVDTLAHAEKADINNIGVYLTASQETLYEKYVEDEDPEETLPVEGSPAVVGTLTLAELQDVLDGQRIRLQAEENLKEELQERIGDTQTKLEEATGEEAQELQRTMGNLERGLDRITVRIERAERGIENTERAIESWHNAHDHGTVGTEGTENPEDIPSEVEVTPLPLEEERPIDFIEFNPAEEEPTGEGGRVWGLFEDAESAAEEGAL